METSRIRIKYPDGQISIVDQSFSQLVETLQGVSREDYKIFLTGTKSVVNSLGWNLKLIVKPQKEY